MTTTTVEPPLCADCGAPAGGPPGPRDGWQLDDGRIVCHDCCVTDFRASVRAQQFSRTLEHFRNTNP